MKNKIIGRDWDMANLWNYALENIPERPLQKRNYIYASELGGSFIDRYLKMNAVPYSNPPNPRSKRKFSSGHIFEWIVGLVMTMTGVLKSRQLRGEFAIQDGMLPVAGKLDFIAGGQVDWDAAAQRLAQVKALFSSTEADVPPIVSYAAEYIFENMRDEFAAAPLKEVVFECKSVSSFMSDKLERTNKPMPHHELQCLHYLLANEMDEAYLFYISKDDSKAYQFSVQVTEELLGRYQADIQQMTKIYNAGFSEKNPLKFAPPKENEVIFDDTTFRFNVNWRIEYSNYLTMLYPQYGSPMAYREFWDSRVSAWNRVFKRAAMGQNITAKNAEIIKDALTVFPDWEQKVYFAQKSGAFVNENETENVEA